MWTWNLTKTGAEIVIYTQDNTIIRKDVDAARVDLVNIYREMLGVEAYATVKNGRI